MAEISYIATLCIKTPHETLTEVPKLQSDSKQVDILISESPGLQI